MAGETLTPNVGFQIPGFNQPNWQVPINYDINLLDKIFGGEVTVPALSIANLFIANIGIQLSNSYVAEVPIGVLPGNAYTLSFPPTVVFGFFWNGLLQVPGIDYNIVGTLLTLTSGATVLGDSVFVNYLK